MEESRGLEYHQWIHNLLGGVRQRRPSGSGWVTETLPGGCVLPPVSLSFYLSLCLPLCLSLLPGHHEIIRFLGRMLMPP